MAGSRHISGQGGGGVSCNVLYTPLRNSLTFELNLHPEVKGVKNCFGSRKGAMKISLYLTTLARNYKFALEMCCQILEFISLI